MSVSVDAVTGKVTCKYCKFHVGHDLDIGHNEGSTVETVDTQQVDIRIDDDKMVIESIVADCQQIMSMVAPGGFSKTVLLAVKKHVSAAKARVQKASLRKPVELGVTHKQPSTEKHDKLLGVRSLPVKRGPLTTGSRMLNAAEVTAVEQLLLARRGADGDTSATDRPSDGLGCSMLE